MAADPPVRLVVDCSAPDVGSAAYVPMTAEEQAQLAAGRGGRCVPGMDNRTLADLEFDQDGQDLACVGCGLTRPAGGPFWRAYWLKPESVARCTLAVPDGEPSYVCPACEPWTLSGLVVSGEAGPS